MARNKKIRGLTVEIGGDTTKLGKSLDDSKGRSKNLQKELREVNKLLKGNPNDVELLAQKETLLKQRVEETTKQLDLLKGSQEKINRMFEQGEIGEEDYRAFQREVQRTQQTLDDLQTDLKKASDHFGQVQRASGEINFKTAEDKVDYLKGKFKDLAQQSADSMKKVSKGVEKGGEKIENVGKKLTPVSAGAAAVLGGGVAAFKDLDEGYDTIVTKTGATAEALDNLKSTANEIFSESVFDMTDIGNVIGEVNTRFGYTDKKLKSASESFLQFAKINNADVSDSVAKSAQIMSAWHLSADKLPAVLGMITAKGQETGISVNTLMGTVLDNNAVFKEMGLTFEQSVGLIAQFEKNGINTSTALTAMKKSVASATKEGKDLGEALNLTVADIKNASTETEALQKATELFGTKGAAEMSTAIRDGRIDFDNISESMSKYSGTVSKTYEATLDPLDKSKTALNNLKLAGSELAGEALELGKPLMEDGVKLLKGATEWFKKLDPEQKKVLVKAIELFAILGPGTTAVGKLTKNVGNIVGIIPKLITKIISMTSATEGATVAQEGLNLAQSANPIGLIIGLLAGAGGLIALLVGLSNASEEAKNKAYELTDKQKANREEVKKLRDAYDEYEQKKSDAISDSSKEFDYYQKLWDELQGIVDQNGKVKDGYESRAKFIIDELEKATGKEIKLNDGVIDSYGKLKDSMKEYLELAKGRAVLSGLEDSYSKAISNKDTAVKERDNAEADMYEKYIEMQRAAAKLKAENDKLNKAEKDARNNKISQGDLLRIRDEYRKNVTDNGPIKKALDSAEEDYKTAKQKYETLEESAASYSRTIQYYEELSAATIENNTEKTSKALKKLETNYITAENGTKKSLSKQTQDIETQLKTARSKYNAGIGNITKDYIKELEDRHKKAKEEEEKYNKAHKNTIEEQFDLQIWNNEIELANERDKNFKLAKLMNEHNDLKSRNLKTASDSTRIELQNQVEVYSNHYEELKSLYDKESPNLSEGEKKRLEEMVNNSKLMVDQATTELKKIPNSYSDVLNDTKDATESGMKAVTETWNTALSNQLSGITDKSFEFKEAGNGQVQLYADGVKVGSPKAKEEMSTLCDGMINEVKDKKLDFKEASEYVLDGIDKGIQNPQKQKNIFDHIWDFGGSILNVFKHVFNIHSPSKATKEIGGYLIDGLSIGISANTQSAVKQAETSAKLVVKSFDKTINNKAAALAKIATKALGTASADFKLDSLSTPVKTAQAQIIYEHRISQQQAQTAQITAVLGKIDTLIKTVESGKVITLDKKTVIGETAKGYDSALGEIALRRERGW